MINMRTLGRLTDKHNEHWWTVKWQVLEIQWRSIMSRRKCFVWHSRLYLGLPYNMQHHHHFWHAPLGVHSAKRRQQWPILSHVRCFSQGEVIVTELNIDYFKLKADKKSRNKYSIDPESHTTSQHVSSYDIQFHRWTVRSVPPEHKVLLISKSIHVTAPVHNTKVSYGLSNSSTTNAALVT